MTNLVSDKTTDSPNAACEIPEDLRPEDLQLEHALRTPLTALKSAIDLLCEGALPPEEKHIARIAQRNAARMVELLETMLLRGAAKS